MMHSPRREQFDLAPWRPYRSFSSHSLAQAKLLFNGSFFLKSVGADPRNNCRMPNHGLISPIVKLTAEVQVHDDGACTDKSLYKAVGATEGTWCRILHTQSALRREFLMTRLRL